MTTKKKQKFGVISDMHCHSFKEHSTIIDGTNSRLRYATGAIVKSINKCVDNGIKTMLVCGDVAHTRGSLKPSVINAIIDAFKYGVEKGIEFFVIPGNHDLENYNYGESAADVLSLLDNVHVFKHPDVVYRPDLGLNILGIPYMHSEKQFMDCYENMAKMHDGINVVMMHQYIDDFTPDVMPKTGITVEWLAEHVVDGTIVLCGHYHEYCSATCDKKNIINVGALLPMKFGDDGKYGMLVSELDKDLVVRLIIDSPKFVTLDKLPRADKDLINLVGGNYVRVRTNTVAKAERMKVRCESAGALSVAAIVLKDHEVPEKRTVIEISSDQKMVADYLKLDDCGVPKDKRPQVYDLFEKVCIAGA